MDEYLALAREAVDAVLADLNRTTPSHPRVVVDLWREHTVRIAVNGCFTTPSMSATTRPEALAEVADYIQEQLDQDLGCWPVCDEHNAGLHAEVRDGIAVWQCHVGGRHVVAAIGELGLN